MAVIKSLNMANTLIISSDKPIDDKPTNTMILVIRQLKGWLREPRMLSYAV